MSALTDYFTKIFVINLQSRQDRWLKCLEQFGRFDIRSVERFEAYYRPLIVDGKPNGHSGCTASHRAVLEIIAHNRWPRVLVLEDDFLIRHDDFNERFASMIGDVPLDWDMLYLGGSYGNEPQYRVSKHVIRINRMHTTSSYGVTWQQARKMAPHISGNTGIDSLYSEFHATSKSYIFQPRLMVQAAGYSDLEERVNEHPEFAMEDPTHENRLPIRPDDV